MSGAPAATGFIDEHGNIISPIAMVNSESVAESDALSVREVSNVTGVTEWQSGRQTGGVVSRIYEQSSMDENGVSEIDLLPWRLFIVSSSHTLRTIHSFSHH